MASTLAGYYSGIGQALPSLSSRASLYEQHGLGKAGEYQGTAQQNTALLGKLSSGSSAAPSYGAAAASSNGGPAAGTVTSAATGSAAPPDVNAAYAPVLQSVSDSNDARKALLDRLSAEGDSNYSELSKAIAGQETGADAYKRIYGSTRVAGKSLDELNTNNTNLQTNIYSTQKELDNLTNTLYQKAQGTLTTKGDIASQGAVQGKSLSDTASGYEHDLAPSLIAYNNGIQTVKDQVGLVQADEAKALQPYQLKIQAFADKAAREISGYDEGAKNFLDAFSAKVNAGIQVSQDEWKQAAAAALAEEGYQKAFEQAQLQANATVKAAGLTAGASTAAAKQTGANEQALAETNYQNQIKLLAAKGKSLKESLGISNQSVDFSKMTPDQQAAALAAGLSSLGS